MTSDTAGNRATPGTVIQRYVSDELTHFVGRGEATEEQYALLVRILESGWLSHPPHDPNISGNLTVNGSAKLSTNEAYSPQIVSFCDVPVQDIHLHAAKYSPFGLSLSKDFIVGNGGAPVLYLPCASRVAQGLRPVKPGEPVETDPKKLFEYVTLGELFDRAVPEYHALMALFRKFIREANSTAGISEDEVRLRELRRFLNFRLFSYVKFFDHRLADDDPNNYYMEREWRVVGNVQFSLADIQRVFVPREFGKRLRDDVPDFFGQITFVG